MRRMVSNTFIVVTQRRIKMNRLFRCLLCLVLCLALLPSAALAASYETGIYLARSEGNPSGACMHIADRSGFGDNGQVTLSGYWDISYSPGEAFEIYYYNAAATSLTARNNGSVTVTQMDAGEQQSHSGASRWTGAPPEISGSI